MVLALVGCTLNACSITVGEFDIVIAVEFDILNVTLTLKQRLLANLRGKHDRN